MSSTLVPDTGTGGRRGLPELDGRSTREALDEGEGKGGVDGDRGARWSWLCVYCTDRMQEDGRRVDRWRADVGVGKVTKRAQCSLRRQQSVEDDDSFIHS
jgi:hypothetical protein